MRKRNLSFFILAVLLLISPLLGGCDESDQELVLDIIAIWAVDDGSVDVTEIQVYDIASKAWEQTSKEFISAEEAVQLNGLDVIDDIERADTLSEEGLTPNNEHLMAEALELRPKDWRIRERDAVLWTMNGNPSATMSAEDKADKLLIEQITNGGDCYALRLQQLRYREQTYQDNYQNCQMRHSCDMNEYQAAHTFVQQELQGLMNTGKTWFCEK